ncbi:MAG: HYR domain-containing protein [Bacteroidetes bacterium]|nr:HYR domain-containing protein [Bacteroidota bacterium]
MNVRHLIALLLFPTVGKGFNELTNCDFTVSETHQSPSCPNENDGSIDLTVKGDEIYSFFWTDSLGNALNNQTKNMSGLAAGMYFVTVTDSLNCDLTMQIEIEDAADTIPPIITCPDNMTVDLPSGECEAVIFFDATVFDACGEPVVFQTDTTGFISGSAFPIGVATLSFEASDGTNTVGCSFQISINEFIPLNNAFLSCSAPLNASIDGNCEANFGAVTFLTGSNYGCYEEYLVVFKNHTGDTLQPSDFHEYIEKDIYVTVKDPESGNSCQTILSLFDNLIPIITCEDTMLFSCVFNLIKVHPSHIGYAKVFDNCGEVDLNFYDQITDLSCEDSTLNGHISKVLHRTWKAVDEYGNFASPCQQVLLFERKTIADIEFPKDLTDKVGDLPSLNCDISDASPLIAGSPMIDSISLLTGGACEMTVDYSDFIIDACGIGQDILRTWTVHDVCQNIIETHLQIIRIKDKTPPNISCLPNKNVSTNVGDCTAIFLIPQADVTDDCSDFTMQFQSSAGFVSGNLLMNIPLGQHILTYTATDECGNQSKCQTEVNVHDGLAPTILCKPSKTVSLTSDGKATVSAATFDNGSYDDCISPSNLKFEIRRFEQTCDSTVTEWKSTMTFCCADVGTPVSGEVRVIDYFGNYNICGSTVIVRDLIPPSLNCPSDIQIECGFDYSDLNVFGKIAESQAKKLPIYINGELVGYDGLGLDNCGAIIETLDPDFDINDCGTGTIKRHFKITDPSNLEQTCTQTIQVVNYTPFYINSIDFQDPTDDAELPNHLTLIGCSSDTDPNATGKPVLLGDGCDLATFTFQDEIVNLPGNAWQIKRNWTIIDFCNFQNGQGKWEYTQHITVLNTDFLPPQIKGFVEIANFCGSDSDCSTGFVDFSLSATDNCSNELDLIWVYKIDLFNDLTHDIFGNSNSVEGEFPIGLHRIYWSVTDEFGNESNAALFLSVEDCAPPTLLCYDTIQVLLYDNNYMTIYAEDLDIGQIWDNCSDFGNLDFRFSQYNPSYNENFPPAGAGDFLFFTCPDDFHTVTAWVNDESNNWGHCHFELHVHDNLNNCGSPIPTVSIAGFVRTENGIYIQDVEVNVNTAFPLNTDIFGGYAFYNLPMGGDYSVVPTKDVNHLNGVTTYDMVLIQKHILNVNKLLSPYKIIAADLNNSGTVTTSDLVEMRKLILNIQSTFSNNESWRFIDADFEFPNPENPFETSFPEYKSFNNLPNSQIVNFVGIKIGDVNNSVNPNN